jgi:hypothetical protein
VVSVELGNDVAAEAIRKNKQFVFSLSYRSEIVKAIEVIDYCALVRKLVPSTPDSVDIPTLLTWADILGVVVDNSVNMETEQVRYLNTQAQLLRSDFAVAETAAVG